MSHPCLEKWMKDNAIATLPHDDRIFKYDSAEQEEIRSAKPWDRDPNYFKSCKISAAALIKMAIHAKSGGNIEVGEKSHIENYQIVGNIATIFRNLRYLTATAPSNKWSMYVICACLFSRDTH